MITKTKTSENMQASFSRRRFMMLGSAVLAAGAVEFPSLFRNAYAGTTTSDIAEMMPQAAGVYTPAPLPYGYDALLPFIDTETMHLHHDKHYVGYTNNLNKALEQAPELKSKKIHDLLSSIKTLPENVRKAIRNNGGGYYNHSLFWQMMTPKQTEKPSTELSNAINGAFGSLDKFKELFAKEAASVFGSGWAWLVLTPKGELKITSTPNQDSPIMADIAEVPGKPILGLDVWEHAYYLKYKNVRADYIASWWNIVNWKTASDLYKEATA